MLITSVLEALNHPTTSHFVQSSGYQLHYRSWNHHESQKPALIMAHGWRGHSHWWDFTAPFLTEKFRVYALDFSGMGDSDNRDEYSGNHHCEDILAVIDAVATDKVYLVGHSYGGGQVLRVSHQRPDLIEKTIVLDTRMPVFNEESLLPFPMEGNPIPYPSYEAIHSRYRLVPAQTAIPELFEHVAHHSIRQTKDGWVWKCSSNVTSNILDIRWREILQEIAVPTAYVRAANSQVVEKERGEEVVKLLGQGQTLINIPEAGHHLMLNQPIATISCLRSLLYPQA